MIPGIEPAVSATIRTTEPLSSARPRSFSEPVSPVPPAADEDPVHWDPFLHAWVVTRYADVVTFCSISLRTARRRLSN